MAFSRGIFDGFGTSGDLFSTWMRRHAEVQAARFQPYADIFLDEVVWPELLAKKDEILAALKDRCATAAYPSQLFVPIWSFSHVFDYPKGAFPIGGPPHEYALERGDKTALRVQEIHDNGWRHHMRLYKQEGEDDYPVLELATVYNVVKKTDFCHQLAARFGANFTVSVSQGVSQTETDPSGEEYTRQTILLMLHYFPWGLPEHHQKKRQGAIEKLDARERRQLKGGEKLIFWKGESVIRYGPPLPPPLPPSPPCPPPDLGPSPAGVVPLLGDGWSQWAASRAEKARAVETRCHCCYTDDGEDEEE